MILNNGNIQAFDDSLAQIASDTIKLQWERSPELASLYGDTGRIKCEEDTKSHLSYLIEAVRTSSYPLFREYIAWAKVLLEKLGLDSRYFLENLKILGETVCTTAANPAMERAASFLEQAVQDFPLMPSGIDTFLNPVLPEHELSRQYLDLLIDSDRRKASELILDAVSRGVSIPTLFRYVFEPVMKEVGRLWQINTLSVAQEHFCTATTQMIICQLYPQIFSSARNGKTFVGACVSTELHELGIRMVTDSFELSGWDTQYLGANTPTDSIIDHLVKNSTDVIGISATVTPHIREVRNIISAIRNNRDLQNTRVLVGGYPFNQDRNLWKEIGADGWALDTQQAIELADGLIS